MTFDHVHETDLRVRDIELKPVFEQAQVREERLAQLGLNWQGNPELNKRAQELAETLGFPTALVNLIGTKQRIGGAFTASGVDLPLTEAPLDVGFCPHVIARRKAFPLGRVTGYARFAGNPIVDSLNTEAYLGTPLFDSTNTPIGTICVLDNEPHDELTMDDVNTIKSFAADLMKQLDPALVIPR